MANAIFISQAAPGIGAAMMRGVLLALLGVRLVSGGMGIAWAEGAQTTADPTAPARPEYPHRPVHARAATPAQAAPLPQPAPAPVQPQLPKWPMNEAPKQPTVKWDSNGLTISAFNASLGTILREVSSETGAKVEGLAADERVFGDYGPGQAREVLAQLLHGSNYDYLMLGDEGQGTPREIILSTHHEGSAAPGQVARPAPESQEEDYQPDQDDQGQPPIFRPQMAPPQQGMPPRTPQQRFDDMRQRQLQMQQQMQQQQQLPQPPEQSAPPQLGPPPQ